MPPVLIVSAVSGVGALALAVFAVWDQLRDRRDTRPDVGLSILRGMQDDSTEAELYGFAEQLHRIRIAPSPLLRRVKAAMDEHDPLTWAQRQAVFQARLDAQRRRVDLACTETRPFQPVREPRLRPVRTYRPAPAPSLLEVT